MANIKKEILEKAYRLICTARSLSSIYEANKEITSKYVHATSKGHEVIQIALALQLKNHDWVSPYYRDDSILLGIGMKPYELMLQLMCKKDDPFSGGRTYYSHPSLKRDNMPKIIHQSSATGMQAIPATGAAMGMNTATGFTTQIDTVLGEGLTAVWIGVLGLALITTGFILQTVRGFLRILLVREFGLD